MKKDTNDAIKEYLEQDFDFGFSTVSDKEWQEAMDASKKEAQDYEERLRELEELIMPLLTNLIKTADQEYIFWPNREKQVKQMAEKVLKLTRRK